MKDLGDTMFTVTKRLEVSASHQLKLDYPSKCQNLHGHNWIITVHARSEELDHRHINDVLGDINPTAENMAKWIADELGPKCFKVEVQESEGNTAIYERD